MALGRWKFNSDGKPSTSSGDNSNGTVTPTGSESQDTTASSKTHTGLLRSLTGSFREHRAHLAKKSAERREFRNRSAQLNKPLTRQNLEHQKILKEFTWEFGNRRLSHSGRSSFSGVSPGGSRRVSYDHGYPTPPSDPKETHAWFSNSSAHTPPHDVSSDDSDKEQPIGGHDFPEASHIESV
ncbi:hypothetical protein F5B20DRAFT_575303 [Whalleya microplaca]|nr:hypothetical protein F5B20DRAFT_575303 [Whalleya microplaca]